MANMFGRSLSIHNQRVSRRNNRWLILALLAALSKCVYSFSTAGFKSAVVKDGVSGYHDSKLGSSKPFFASESDKSSSNSRASANPPQSTLPGLGPGPPSLGDLFDPTPDALIAKARVVIATDLGIQDPTVLSDDFIWIRPLADKPLGRVDYVAAGRFFNLRSTFPDLDYRAHDFRIDVDDPLTVRCTSRPVGTMRGSLRLRNEIVEANGKILRGPPEAISMTFDGNTGKLTKLCSEFVMDRQVGNTNGLCGVMAAATLAGVPPSDWEVYPAPAVFARFFGRPIQQLKEPVTFLAPFPETVMISLAKGVIFANLGLEDPSLLSKGFCFLTSTVGPIPKSRFLEFYAAQQFGDFESDYSFSNYRVDPYDPYRVWTDVKLSGSGLEGPPQAYSFTFDDDGFCTRITGGAVLDPSIGNTGGLPGIEGIRYALGEGSPDLTTRPLPVALGRLRKSILSPVTKIDTDEFVLVPSSADKAKPSVPKEDAAAARKRILQQAKERIEQAEATKRKTEAARKAAQAARLATPPSPPKVAPPKAQPPKTPPPVMNEPSRTEPLKSETPKLDFSSFNAKTPPSKTESGPKIIKVDRLDSNLLERVRNVSKPNEKRPSIEIPKFSFPQLTFELPKMDSRVSSRRAKPMSSDKSTGEARDMGQKQKLEMLRKKQEEVKERVAVQAEKKRKVAEEARRKRIDAQSKIAAEKRAALEKEMTAQAEARQKQEQTRQKIALKNAEDRRQKIEEQRQKQVQARKQQEAKLMATEDRTKNKSAKKPSSTKPSFSLPRPSLQIPKPIAPKAPSNVENQQSVSPTRPSLQIPKPTPPQSFPKTASMAPRSENRPPFSLPRPSLSIPNNKLKRAPKGVPTVVAWSVRSDGGIAGQVFGSLNFREGQRFETSAIVKGELENGSVVTTKSGSRYFLSDKTFQQMKQETGKPTALPNELRNAAPSATIQLTRQAMEREKKAALESVSQAKPGITISLSSIFGLGQDDDEPTIKAEGPSPRAIPQKPLREAPKGVPTIERWKAGKDKTITGFIRGSSKFREGEKVTTSPISKGTISNGELVVTSSGTKYFLA